MFSAPPSTGHLLPALPTLQALRSAGHDVLVAAYGGRIDQYLQLGVSVVDVGDDVGLAEMYERFVPGARYGYPGETPEAVFRAPSVANAALSRRVFPRLLELTIDWVPDLLIYDPFQGAMPLTAAIRGIPAVEHQSGMISGRVLTQLIGEHLADLYRGHGMSGPPAVASIEIVPPSLRDPDPQSLQARYVSPHGSAVLPADLTKPAVRPRVVISFGTVLSSNMRDDRLAALLPVLARHEAEFLLPAAVVDNRDVGDVPANVRLLAWAPLAEILRYCDGIIHHGGAGTFMSAVVAGTPQLIVPHAGDQYFNARLAQKHGFGIAGNAVEDISGLLIDQLLTDHRLRASAERIQQENAQLPPPSALVPELERLSRR
jgi:UDP:flavonoid glycosyltransferase YjiC (YdhE family)